MSFIIKDLRVTGGDKVITPFGDLIFERTHKTDSEEIAAYFGDKCGYSVEEVEDPEETDPSDQDAV